MRRKVHKPSAGGHRHKTHPGLASGIIYAFAATLAVAMGFVFFRHVQRVRSGVAVDLDEPRRDLPPNVRIISKRDLQASPSSVSSAGARTQPVFVAAATQNWESPAPSEAIASRESEPLSKTPDKADVADVIREPCLLPVVPWKPDVDSLIPMEKVRLLPVADTAIITPKVGGEAINAGAATSLPVRGNEAFLLAKYDVSAIRGWTITRATWSARIPNGSKARFGFSAICAPWQEGTGTFETRATNGATFEWADFGKSRWRDDSLPFSFLVRGNGTAPFCLGELPHVSGADAATDDWVHVSIDPAIVQGMVAGWVHGLAVSDEMGQLGETWWIPSRESEAGAHYLTIEGARADILPPGAVKNLQAVEVSAFRRANSSGVILAWIAGGDDHDRGQVFAYDIRYGPEPVMFDTARRLRPESTPRPQPSGRPDKAIIEGLMPDTSYVFFVRPMDESGQAGPVSECRFRTSPATAFPSLSSPAPFASGVVNLLGGALQAQVLDELQALSPFARADKDAPANMIWDRNTRTIRFRAAQGETLGFIIQLSRMSPESFPLLRLSMDAWTHPKHQLSATSTFFRVWFSRTTAQSQRTGWVADALLPLPDGLLDIRKPDNRITNAVSHYVFGELHIPASAQPGNYVSRVLFSDAAGTRTDSINVVLEVLPLSLCVPPNFTIELAVAPALVSLYKKGQAAQAANAELEKAYRRLAATHCCAMAIPAADAPGWTPETKGRGNELQITRWDDWDARVSGFLTVTGGGSLAEERVVEPCMILPVSEKWPITLLSAFGCTDRLVKNRSGQQVYSGDLADMGDCVSTDYWYAWRIALQELRKRLDVRGGGKATYHVWLTGETGMADRWTPWNFGAPVYRADFAALDMFGRLVHSEAPNWNSVGALIMRGMLPDVSLLPLVSRKTLDLLCVSDASPGVWQCLRVRRRETGENLWLRTAAPAPEDGAVATAAAVFRCLALGADGWSVEDALGRAEDWGRAAARSLMYCGAPFGEERPYPSLRLKAIRRAWQDLVYLRQLQNRAGWSSDVLSDFVAREWPSLLDGERKLKPEEVSATRIRIQTLLLRGVNSSPSE